MSSWVGTFPRTCVELIRQAAAFHPTRGSRSHGSREYHYNVQDTSYEAMVADMTKYVSDFKQVTIKDTPVNAASAMRVIWDELNCRRRDSRKTTDASARRVDLEESDDNELPSKDKKETKAVKKAKCEKR